MDLFDLSGKTAVVTGGTRGIGLMMARGLLEAGASVYISSRKADACAEASRELSAYGQVFAVPADLSGIVLAIHNTHDFYPRPMMTGASTDVRGCGACCGI